jgi:hypothetical protein
MICASAGRVYAVELMVVWGFYRGALPRYDLPGSHGMPKSLTEAQKHNLLANLVAQRVRAAGFQLVSVKSSPGLLAVPVADAQDIGIVCSPTSEDYQSVISKVHKYIAAKHRFTRIVVVRPSQDESFAKRLKKSFDVDTTVPPEIGEYLREWREVFEDEERDRSPFRSRINKEIAHFSELVQGKIRNEGFETVSHAKYWFVVSVGRSRYAGVVPANHLSRELVAQAVRRTKVNSATRVSGTVVVLAKELSDRRRDELSKLYDADVIALSEVERYFRAFKAQQRDEPRPQARAKQSPSVPIKTNADAIIAIARSLAIQIDTKLDSLREQKLNDPDSIAAKEAAISEYQELRDRVAELEQAVAQLRAKNPRIEPAVKAGRGLRKHLDKWWDKSSGKVFAGLTSRGMNSLDMGIACAGAGLLMLMGVDGGTAASCAAAVVTGKAFAARKKKK